MRRIRLDEDFLREVGLDELPVRQQNEILRRCYEALEAKVGIVLARTMNDRQLSVFEQFMDSGDDGAALAWLAENLPEYPEVVSDLMRDLTERLRQVVSATQRGSGKS